MKLYFSPLACSLAARIVFYEAGADAEFVYVETKAKQVADGSEFHALNPIDQVPILITDEGERLLENAAILQYVADRIPGGLAPASGLERARLQQWLSFVGTELHKACFVPLLDEKAEPAVKAYARDKLPARMAALEHHLSQSAFLLEQLSVADAYLTAVLNWAAHVDVDLGKWPAVKGYFRRMLQRPSVARALAEEVALYQAQQARRASA
jgi:glutathione S-transferase